MQQTAIGTTSETAADNLSAWADRFVSVSETSNISGLAPSTIWQKVSRREFPAPYKISANRTAWSFRELQDWIAERKQAAYRGARFRVEALRD